MAIVDEDIQRVRDAADAVAIVSQYTQLKRVGRGWSGLCPFHNEKSPSFSVSAEKGLYYCFGCQVSGDMFGFVMAMEGIDFPAAVELLAERAGISLRYSEEGGGERRQRVARLRDAVESATAWYHDRLLNAPDAGAARQYLRTRGYDGDTVRRYRLGWAPDAWDQLVRALRLPADVMVDAGLGYRNQRGSVTDQFRDRLLFPINDVQGRPVGFGGRILPGHDGPKYKNSPDSAVYGKSRLLYALDSAKTDAARLGRIVVCEGYTDVIAFQRAGVGEAVATCGTALTEDHVRMLTRFARHIVLAFDADAAGENAAARVHQWEEAHGLDVSVVRLPGGLDPADAYDEDPTLLPRGVEEAVPFLGWRLERVLSAGRYDSPEHRARTAEEALLVISEHPNELVRDQYVLEVAQRCSVPSEALRDRIRGAGRVRPVRAREERRDRGEVRVDRMEGPEVEALRVLTQRPGEIAHRLASRLFADEVCERAYRTLSEIDDVAEAAASLGDDPAAALIRRATVEETEADGADVVGRLVAEATRRRQRRYQEESRRGDADSYAPLLSWIAARLAELPDDHTGPAALASLEAWLAELEQAA